jgi:hypothetical protein
VVFAIGKGMEGTAGQGIRKRTWSAPSSVPADGTCRDFIVALPRYDGLFSPYIINKIESEMEQAFEEERRASCRLWCRLGEP